MAKKIKKFEGWIYKITSPSGKYYIGQAVNINRRYSDYKRLHHCKNQPYLLNSIKKYGFDNFEKEILDYIECNSNEELQEKLNTLEIEYILKYDSTNKNKGYNISKGGNQGRLGVKETEEQKQKKRDAWTLERKKVQSELWKTDANPRKGKNFGRSNFAKYVNQYSLDGNLIKTWESLSDITRNIPNFSFKNISKCCNHEVLTSYGYIWRFKEECDLEKIEVDLTPRKSGKVRKRNTTMFKAVNQYDKDLELIKEWDSITDASKHYNIPTTNISKCCKGERKSAGGFIWKYKN